jgi:hypothetical protein
MLYTNTETTEQVESNLVVSLLAKRAIINSQCAPAASIITVSERGVFFANASNPCHGLKFSLTEWFEVVDFVNQQIAPDAPVVEEWEPDWATIGSEINYVSVDADRHVYGYEQEPQHDDRTESWRCAGGGGYTRLRNVTAPNSIPWKQSLRIRPGV